MSINQTKEIFQTIQQFIPRSNPLQPRIAIHLDFFLDEQKCRYTYPQVQTREREREREAGLGRFTCDPPRVETSQSQTRQGGSSRLNVAPDGPFRWSATINRETPEGSPRRIYTPPSSYPPRGFACRHSSFPPQCFDSPCTSGVAAGLSSVEIATSRGWILVLWRKGWH